MPVRRTGPPSGTRNKSVETFTIAANGGIPLTTTLFRSSVRGEAEFELACRVLRRFRRCGMVAHTVVEALEGVSDLTLDGGGL